MDLNEAREQIRMVDEEMAALFVKRMKAVEDGGCDVAVLPIGPLGNDGTQSSDVKTVVSHPQALSQCWPYIQKHGFAIRSAANTAVAAQETASAGDKTTAAIASAETAALYGLEVLDHDINESRDNTTRFAVFSRTEDRPAQKQKGGAFLLLFTVKDEAGGLAKAVNIISFNPLIVTKDAKSAIALFEALGFEQRHIKEGISENNVTDVRMKNADGFHVDVSQGTGEWTMIRMNVDDLEEAIAFLEARGFHKARHEVANKTIDTGSSRLNIMVSPSGFIFAVSQHVRDDE